MSTDPGVRRCAVCAIEGAAADLAECADCGGWFHLDLDRRALRRSCGAPTFGSACGFSFHCDPCIARSEAAAAAGGPWRSAVR